MTEQTIRGHAVQVDESGQTFLHGVLVNPDNLSCIRCGKLPIDGDSDYCLGRLPGVSHACCGHGGEGYIIFENGVEIRGVFEVKR